MVALDLYGVALEVVKKVKILKIERVWSELQAKIYSCSQCCTEYPEKVKKMKQTWKGQGRFRFYLNLDFFCKLVTFHLCVRFQNCLEVAKTSKL